MNGTLDFARWHAEARSFAAFVVARILSRAVLIELAVIAITGVLAGWIAPQLIRFLKREVTRKRPRPVLGGMIDVLGSVAIPSLWLFLLWIGSEFGRAAGFGASLAGSAAALLVAWIAIRLVSHVVRSRFWSRLIFVAAWSIAALQILGFLDRIEASLKRFGFAYGHTQVTALAIVRALIALAIFLWLVTLIRGFLERRIQRTERLTPTLQALLVQTLRLVLPALAILATLPVLGINLTALTVFGGALAVGAGLGLQRAVANLSSGFLILGSGSIRLGDVIAVKDQSGASSFGRVTAIGATFLSLRTRGGREFLVPNESFVSGGIENWSHSDRNVRLNIPFGISYGCDPRIAITLAQEAAGAVRRIIAFPRPVCLLIGFGDSSVQFELRVWIEDPMNGVANVKSECLLEIWDRFRAHGIAFPFPQRDVRIVSLPDTAVANVGEAPPPLR